MDENDNIQEIWNMVGWRGVVATMAVLVFLIFAMGRRRKNPTLLDSLADRVAQQHTVLQSISDRLSSQSSIIDQIHDRLFPSPSMGDRITGAAAPLRSAVDDAMGSLSQAPSDAWKTIKQTVSHG